VKYLFDTDHISFLQRGTGSEYAALAARLAHHPLTDFTYSVISFHEQLLGAHGSINRARTKMDVIRGYNVLLEILQGFMSAPVLPFDTAASAAFDGLKAQRLHIATMDLRIAAIALSQGLIVLTRNVRDFGRVPGLLTEDWTV
jgi:tRNA(fMet)-specific endonuclease VapC